MLRTRTHKYIHNEDDTPELYHLSEDPGETRNLLHGDGVSEEIRELAARMRSRIGDRWVGNFAWPATEDRRGRRNTF